MKQRISELFDTIVEPKLSSTEKSDEIIKHIYTFPSRKTDKQYYVIVNQYDTYSNPTRLKEELKNVLEIDFNLGSISLYMLMSNLNEVSYVLKNVYYLLMKYKNNSDWYVVESNKPRIKLYKKLIERIPGFNLVKEDPNFLMYSIS